MANTTSPTETPDVTVDNNGSIITFHLNTEAAQEFAEDVHAEDYMRTHDGFHAEPRYAQDIIEAMQNDGLTVEFN